MRATVWAFIYVIEHTKTIGGGTEKYAHQVGRPKYTASGNKWQYKNKKIGCSK